MNNTKSHDIEFNQGPLETGYGSGTSANSMVSQPEHDALQGMTRRQYRESCREHSNLSVGQYIGASLAVTSLVGLAYSTSGAIESSGGDGEVVTIQTIDEQTKRTRQDSLIPVQSYDEPIETPPADLWATPKFTENAETTMAPVPKPAEAEQTLMPVPEVPAPEPIPETGSETTPDAPEATGETIPVVAASPPVRVRMNTDEVNFDVNIIPEDGFVTGVDEQGNRLYNFSAKPGDFVNGVYWTKAANPGTDPAYFESQLEQGLGTTVMIGAHQSSRSLAAFNGLLPENVQLGDTFEIESADGYVFTYQVKTTLDPIKGTLADYENELSIYVPNEAVLIACIPNGLAPSKKNFVVRGELIGVRSS